MRHFGPNPRPLSPEDRERADELMRKICAELLEKVACRDDIDHNPPAV
jgi:hypothetical protein